MVKGNKTMGTLPGKAAFVLVDGGGEDEGESGADEEEGGAALSPVSPAFESDAGSPLVLSSGEGGAVVVVVVPLSSFGFASAPLLELVSVFASLLLAAF